MLKYNLITLTFGQQIIHNYANMHYNRVITLQTFPHLLSRSPPLCIIFFHYILRPFSSIVCSTCLLFFSMKDSPHKKHFIEINCYFHHCLQNYFQDLRLLAMSFSLEYNLITLKTKSVSESRYIILFTHYHITSTLQWLLS